MITSDTPYYSEDDIRSKVAYQWLRDCGLSANDVTLEHTFKIQTGRNSKTVHSRADVLVKVSGRNLLILEIKRPTHNLADSDKNQAISYARMLCDGIAPFTVLTNGRQTLIYDSITGEALEGEFVPDNHSYVRAGFKVTSDGIKARMEALEFFISLSPDNLLSFCEGQVNYRMQVLKGVDIHSGKKYIPALYVPRNRSEANFRKKLLDQKETPAPNFLLVVGQPQQGKTCFMCHTILQLLKEGYACLFYPAVALRGSLLREMQEDFAWCFDEHMEMSLWIKRLERLGEAAGKRMVIFIDGWNEMTENAIALNDECRRLNCSNISIVLSTTSPSLLRLLKDRSDNIGYVAEKANLQDPLIRKLMSEPIRDAEELNIVQIGKFDFEEVSAAVQIYSDAYSVQVERTSELLSDPFYLRLACEQYAGDAVPSTLTRTTLIKDMLTKKGARRGIGDIKLFTTLNELAGIFFTHGRPADTHLLAANFKEDADFYPWTESAILVLFTNQHTPQVDFYFTHDFHYSVGLINRRWDKIFEKKDRQKLQDEVALVDQYEANRDAMRWFFSCPEHYELLKNAFQVLDFYTLSLPIRICLASAVFLQVKVNDFRDTEWIEPFIRNLTALSTDAIDDEDEFPELVVSYMHALSPEKEPEKFNTWLAFLITVDYSIDASVEESFTYELLNEKWDGFDIWTAQDDESRFDDTVFQQLIRQSSLQVARRAACFLATYIRDRFLDSLPGMITFYESNGLDIRPVIEPACSIILHDLSEGYYGSMCPGWFNSFEDEAEYPDGIAEVKKEFETRRRQFQPVLSVIGANSGLFHEIRDVLKDLQHYADYGKKNDDASGSVGKNEEIHDPAPNNENQYKLDL